MVGRRTILNSPYASLNRPCSDVFLTLYIPTILRSGADLDSMSWRAPSLGRLWSMNFMKRLNFVKRLGRRLNTVNAGSVCHHGSICRVRCNKGTKVRLSKVHALQVALSSRASRNKHQGRRPCNYRRLVPGSPLHRVVVHDVHDVPVGL